MVRFSSARSALLLGVSALVIASVNAANAQQFKPVGTSGPETGKTEDLSSFAPPAVAGQRFGSNAGDIPSLVFDPTSPNRIFAGSANGGVWGSTDGGIHWTPLTDTMRSLSIDSISLDATNLNTIIAGTGLSSTGAFIPSFNVYQDRSPAALNGGLLVSHDGGTTWSEIDVSALTGQSISGVAIRGTTIMATGYELNNKALAGGLYRSTDNGATFSQVVLPGRAGNSPASSLVADPTSPNTFYVASVISGGNSQVFKSIDNGATWNAVLTVASANTVLKIATAPGGAVAVYGIGSTNKPTFLALSQNGGGSFTDLSSRLTATVTVGATNMTLSQALNGGGQGAFHAGIAIDPNNTNAIYLAGDSVQNFNVAGGFYSPVYRVTLDGLNPPGSPIQLMTALGLNSQSFSHADTHNLYFDPSGRLVAAADGGIFRLSTTDPTTASWSGLNGTLQTKEQYAIAYDSRNHVIATASQDNGTAIQTGRDSAPFVTMRGGDGVNAQINDTHSSGISYVYGSSQGLGGLFRTPVVPGPNGTDVVKTFLFFNVTAGSEPTVREVGDSSENLSDKHPPLDVESDRPQAGVEQDPDITVLFSSQFALNRVDQTKFAFTGRNVWVGQDIPGEIEGCFNATQCYDEFNVTSVAKNNATIAPGILDNFTTVDRITYGVVDSPDALLIGGRRFIGNARLGLTTTSTLASMVMFDNYGQGVGPASIAKEPSDLMFDGRTVSRFFVADSNSLWGTTNATIAGSPNAAATFLDLTPNLPAGFVKPTSLEFISSNGVNALVVGGINSAANAGDPLVVADSDGSGVLSGWRRFGVGLPNGGIDAMTYRPSVDVLAISSYGRGSWLYYDTTAYFASATELAFGKADNDSTPPLSILTGNRPLSKYGTGTTLITGSPTYTGLTTVKGGTLIVNGSLLDSVTVNFGTVFGGNATVGGTLTNNGTISPGNSPGTIVAGAYVAGGSYLAQVEFNNAGAPVNGTTHDFLDVTGNVTGTTTVINVVPFPPSGSPVATTGNGMELVRVGGSTVASNFALSGPVIEGGYQYVLNYLKDYSGTLDGFFLQSTSRQELWGNAAILSSGQALTRACLRGDDRMMDTPNDPTTANGWAKVTSGSLKTGADSGIDSKQDYTCGSGGLDFPAGPHLRLGVTGGYGNTSVGINTIAGHDSLEGNGVGVEAVAAFVADRFFVNVSAGYNQTDWSYHASLLGQRDVTSSGLIGSAQAGMGWPLWTNVTAHALGEIDYDDSGCGDSCLIAGTTEDIGKWFARGTLRLDGSFHGGSVLPYAAVSYGDQLGGGNKVIFGGAVLATNTADSLLGASAGLKFLVSGNVALFADFDYTDSLTNDVHGLQGTGGLTVRF